VRVSWSSCVGVVGGTCISKLDEVAGEGCRFDRGSSAVEVYVYNSVWKVVRVCTASSPHPVTGRAFHVRGERLSNSNTTLELSKNTVTSRLCTSTRNMEHFATLEHRLIAVHFTSVYKTRRLVVTKQPYLQYRLAPGNVHPISFISSLDQKRSYTNTIIICRSLPASTPLHPPPRNTMQTTTTANNSQSCKAKS
jgi:hypothetical protein